MADTTLTRRYAQAMFELAQERRQAGQWQQDIEALAAAAGERMIRDVLENPAVSRHEKDRLLSQIAADIDPLVINLVKLLIARSSIRLLGEIAVEYGRLLDESRGTMRGNVITAVPLGDDEKQQLDESISGLLGKKVELQPAVDPDILGGMVVRVGGKLLDGSTRSKLAALKRQLASGEKRR